MTTRQARRRQRDRTSDILFALSEMTGLRAVVPDTSPGFDMEAKDGFHMAYNCPHIVIGKPVPYGVVYALLSDPFVGYCVDCFMPVMRESCTNSNCDVCGKEAVRFQEVQVGLGRLMLAGNVCMACHGANGWKDVETHLRVKMAEQRVAVR